MQIADQLQRILHIEKTPKRIVSLVPSQTELLCDLGLKDYLVGVTKFCIHPNTIRKEVAVVGGTKQVHFDKIKALQPDIILCNKEENTKEIVEACALISKVHVSDIFTLEDSLELIQQYGVVFECSEKASRIIEKISSEFESFQKFIKEEPTMSVAYFIWKNPWMVAANNTFINYLLEVNKFENVFRHKSRYPEIDFSSSGEIANADLILLSSEPFPFKETHKKEAQEIFTEATVLLVDGEMFSWYGSRLMLAFQYFKTLRLNLQNTQL
ncbi:helical backbone metal receptor [Tamlana sp. 2_MG-2023]|uniref:ABC transporter substrate-binding protein n=1 Tax=unclassified Tamlana TaxID=2614803 RepID=UPI0026E3D2C0|nr:MULTISPECIES: helical backbone metal receptor [unclassified Tamlana]MDO6759020.1 helical backbone metal receptor [Tamlana sp. 2_MG-2023]MDO6789719.1 helical backbone metal receptor [Tamlana sp. 1_MG-2023]